MDYDNDPLVKSIGARMNDQKAFKRYIRNFNSLLLGIQPLNFPSVTYAHILEILRHVDRSNKNMFEPQGIRLTFGVIRLRY